MNDTDKQVEYRGTGFYVSLVFVAIVVIALIAFTIQNTESVTFEFLLWDVEIPLFGIILIVAFLAVTIDELVGLVWRRTRRKRLTEKQELKRLRKDREAPATDGDAATDSEATTTSPPSVFVGDDEGSDPKGPA